MIDASDECFGLLAAAHAGFQRRLQSVRPDCWDAPTPCAGWSVRDLVNHVVLAEVGYRLLLGGGSAQEFIQLQQRDAVGADPVAAYGRAAAGCAAAFREPGALERIVDYPLGAVAGRQLLYLRVTERVLHSWDLARAAGLDDRLDPGLVDWIGGNLDRIYHGVAGSPLAPGTGHQYFARPPAPLPAAASAQDRLLQVMGRRGGTAGRTAV